MVDFNLNPGPPLINDDLKCIRQQVDILFGTRPGDLLGDINYGTEYDHYLYDLKLSGYELSERMIDDLYSLDLLGWSPNVETKLLMGTEQDIALIEVELVKGGQTSKQIYRID